jgi:hypothetical protein
MYTSYKASYGFGLLDRESNAALQITLMEHKYGLSGNTIIERSVAVVGCGLWRYIYVGCGVAQVVARSGNEVQRYIKHNVTSRPAQYQRPELQSKKSLSSGSLSTN